MANDQQTQTTDQKPWETFSKAQVVATPPAGERGTPQAQPSDTDPSPPSDKPTSPAERFANYKVVDSREAYEGNLADATAQAVTDAAIAGAESQAAERSTGQRVMDWVGNVGRSTLIGPVADPIAALILSKKFEKQGITYKQALDVVRANNAATSNTSSTIVGALLGGGLAASGLKKSAQWATTKSGMARGAMQWASRDRVLNRVVQAAAAGGAAGAVEEGVRTSLEESIDATGGHGFDTGRIVDNVVLGAMIGAIATPTLQEGLNGSKWFANFIKKTSGSSDEQTYAATKRILKEFARDGEDLDQAADRFRQRVQEFRIANGRMPAAAEVMAPEQVANVAEVTRVFNGLDLRARDLGEKGVERALRDYDNVVTNGTAIPSPEFIENQMEELFTDVMKRNGDQLVTVNDETMTYLMRNRDWISQMAKNGNEGASRMAHILDAQANINQMKTRYQRLMDRSNTADARVEVNALKEDLATLLDDAFRGGGAEASQIAELRNLIQLRDAIATRAASERNATSAAFDLAEFKPMLDRTMAELDTYAQNGLRIRLSDANNIRSTAARHFNIARYQDADKADAARRVRDAVAPIGKEEVPEYANVVKRWNLEMNRAEAQATGIQAARGDIDLMDLETRLANGRLPGKPKASNAEQQAAIRTGAGEGTRREIQNSIRGGTAEGVTAARRVAGSQQTQKAIAETLGAADAKAITRSANQVVDTYESMKALARPTSVSSMAEERQFAAEVMTGAAFGNLGGAGRAALMNRILTKFQIPRGTAKKMVEMLGNPNEVDKALAFMQKKGIRVGPLFSAVLNHLTEPQSNAQ